jgi:hypothetical protein
MSEIDDLKAEIRKLSAQAITAKMNLHDLSEELPINWRAIPAVAEAARAAYAALEAARGRLKQLETA